MGSALDASKLKGFVPEWCCDLAMPSVMRITCISIVCSGLLVGGTVYAQIPRLQSTPEWQSLKIQQTVEPIFPQHLAQSGLTEGMTHLAINTDPAGKLVEWLVVSYTHREFADAAVAALKQWKFEPAQFQGERVGTTVELVFRFEAKGVVISTFNISDAIEVHTLRMMGTRYIYQPCSLRELDRIPTPIVTVTPTYPKELADRGVKGKVTVEFYIDESGAVRMPAVSIDDNSILTGLAVSALRQWRFEPPTRNGNPVLVRASQVFKFGSQ
jgi:TonB family protein